MDIVIKSVECYLKILFKTINSKHDQENSSFFYRGQADAEYKFLPKILRSNYVQKEHDIYNRIMVENTKDFEHLTTANEVLSKMQHYGVPTRLLDITTNPLVALYFACYGDNEKDKDGAVYILDPDSNGGDGVRPYDSDRISIISALPRFSNDDKERIRKLAMKKCKVCFNKNKTIKRLLHEIKKEKPSFEDIIQPNDLLKNYYFVPKKTNDRIIKQSGAFIIFGLAKNNTYMDRDTGIYDRIIVKSEAKSTILSELSILEINKFTLFPELDSRAVEIYSDCTKGMNANL